MGIPNGNCGGLAYEVEATWGTTPGSAWTWVYPGAPTASTLGFRPSYVQRGGYLQCGAVTDLVEGSFVDGELNLLFSQEEDIYGGLLGLDSNVSTLVYTFGLGGKTPDSKAVSVLMNYAGDYDGTPTDAHEWIATGCKANSHRWTFQRGNPVQYTLAMTGKAMVKTSGGSAEVVATPASTYVAFPGALTGNVLTEGGNEIEAIAATIEVVMPKTGFADRGGLSSTMLEQQLIGAAPEVRWSLDLHMDDTASVNDTIDMLADFLAGTDAGTIVLGSTVFSLSGCQTQGDWPALVAGMVPFTLSGKATGCALTMVDNIT